MKEVLVNLFFCLSRAMPVWWRGRAELFGEDAQNCLAAGVPPFLLVTKISSPSKITTVSSHSLTKGWGDVETFVAVLRIILQRPAVYPLGWQAPRRRITAGDGNAGKNTVDDAIGIGFLGNSFKPLRRH